MIDPRHITLADLTSPTVLANPYPVYADLRRQEPVHLDPQSNTWMFTRYSDVAAVLSDQRFSVGRAAQGDTPLERTPIERALSLQMLFQDPPSHTRLRSLFTRAFTPHRVERLRPQVHTMVHELFDRCVTAAKTRQVDFIRDLAEPFPVIVISELLGIPADTWPQMTGWSYSLGHFLTGGVWDRSEAEKTQGDVLSMSGYIGQLVQSKRTRPGDDLISGLLSVEDLGDRLSTEELIVNLMLLFAGGHLTTTHLLGNAMLALSETPAEWERLVGEPALAVGVVNETLRYDAAVQAVRRQAREDVEFAGKLIRAGDQVIAFLGSANRDEVHFPQPDRFDMTRKGVRSLAFGHGIHACLGAALARLEGDVLFTETARRFPKAHLPQHQPTRVNNYMIRGVTSLPLCLE